MQAKQDKVFHVSSLGNIFRKSLEMFAYRLEDETCNVLSLDDIKIEQKFFIVFQSGTGLTKTSAVRLA